MRFFVTGGTGFIGSHFLRQALEAGHSVVAPRRAASTIPPDLPGAEWIDEPLDSMSPARFDGCDALVHFAAVGVSPQQATRKEMIYWNVEVPLYLLETASAAGVPRAVFAGTFAEYGRSADNYDLIPPDAPLLPTSNYASSKAACFVAAHGLAIERSMQLCYLRIFSAFGEGQFESNLWPSLRHAAVSGRDFPMTSGEQIRDFISVEHVAAAFMDAATRGDIKAAMPWVRNVGSGEAISLAEFAKKWWHLWEATGDLKLGAVPYRPNEVMRFVPLITD